MKNINQISREITNFFDDDFELQHVQEVLIDKLEDYMKTYYGVPDWKGDEIWALHFAKHILEKPLSQLSLNWIWDRIKQEALREILED